MAGSVYFDLSPQVLFWARSSMGYSIDEVSNKIRVPSEKYKSWESGENKPTYRQLEELAEKVFKRSLALLLIKTPIEEEGIEKSFRNMTNSAVHNLTPQMRYVLRRAKRFQLILAEVNNNESRFSAIPKELPSISSAEEMAESFRLYLDFTFEQQIKWKNPEEAIRKFQSMLERVGIYIFRFRLPLEEARAFCLSGEFPVIFLNSVDSKNGSIFSLFHEVCHVLMNTNDLFIVDRPETYSYVENFCNTFAASFLVPDSIFNEEIKAYERNNIKFEENGIRKLAEKFKVSNEVIARKLLERNLVTQDFFWAKKNIWDSIAKMSKEKQKENDIKIPQAVRLLHEKGRAYVAEVIGAYNRGSISSSELSSYLEIKVDNLAKVIERLND